MFETELFETPPPSFDELDLSDAEWDLIDLPAETGWASIPARLDEMTPGPVQAVLLSTIDVTEVSPRDRVQVLKARQRLSSHVQAGFYGDLIAIADALEAEDGDVELATEAAALEVRAALRLTRRTADMEMDMARDLCRRLPGTGRALADGLIDLRRARVLVNGTAHLSVSDANEVISRLLEEAHRHTTGQLRAKVRRACFQIDPEEARSRYQTAHDDRRLVSEPTVDGTVDAHLFGLAPHRAAEAIARVNEIAKSLCGPDETRTIDQLRADVAIDLICGEGDYGSPKRGVVNLTVDLATLAELQDSPGELAGCGPVVDDIARQLAESQGEAEWRWAVTHPQSEQTVANGVTRKRRANISQRRYVEARDRTCVFPGCRAPAETCDLDHIEPWSETGHTSTEELAPLCRSDHTQRHRHDWTYRSTGDGDYEWTSRLGHRYRTSGLPPPEDPD